MKYDPEVHHRRSIRLKGHDYSRPGAYFVTTFIHGRESIPGTIVDDALRLSKAGQIVRGVWMNLPRHYPNIQLDEFCIMPNHIHGVIIILDNPRPCRGGSRWDGSCRGVSHLSEKVPLPEGETSGEGCLPARETRPPPIDIRYRNSSGRINRFRRSRSMSSETRQGCRYGKVVGVRGMLKLLLYRPVPIHAQGFAVLVGNCHQLGFNDLIRLHDQC